jgi:hypothetical protein
VSPLFQFLHPCVFKNIQSHPNTFRPKVNPKFLSVVCIYYRPTHRSPETLPQHASSYFLHFLSFHNPSLIAMIVVLGNVYDRAEANEPEKGGNYVAEAERSGDVH